MQSAKDTIVAVATPTGRGGVGIVRVSGSEVLSLAEKIIGQLPPPRKAVHAVFKDDDNEPLDDGIVLYFPAPHSFTGEHVLELQGHGGPVVLDLLIRRCLQLGARLANPGEFSLRAFLNNKLDLTQAEAIADLIDSGSEQAARSALRSLQGDFSKAINELLEQVIHLRVYVEAALDFPEEEIDFLQDASVIQQLDGIKQQLKVIRHKAQQGQILRDGVQLVIVGKPNAGKSSLLNALAEQETAIVTDIAGTTRDILREAVNLDGIPLHLIDTAGLRESDDPVERIGIERAWKAVEQADLILLLIDDSTREKDTEENRSLLEKITKKTTKRLPLIRVHNKIDLSGHAPGVEDDDVYISAKFRHGIDQLKTVLKNAIGYRESADTLFTARRRHLDALENTRNYILQAEQQLREFNAGELMAEELRLAQEELGQITGRFTADDLLGEIFSSFCIGK